MADGDAEFNAMTARLLRREALRRAAHELNTTSGPGLESALSQISADVTSEAAERQAARISGADQSFRHTNGTSAESR